MKKSIGSVFLVFVFITISLSCAVISAPTPPTLTPVPPTFTPVPPTFTPEPTATATPSATPTHVGPPTYSQVLETYPTDVYLCKTNATVEAEYADGQMQYDGEIEIVNNQFLIQCFGTKITLKISVTLDGTTYPPGTKLTVDKDLHWIEVSSWE